MRRKPRRALFLAGVLTLTLVAAVGALAKGANGPIGHYPNASLTLSRWAGDPWETETKTAGGQWSTATGGQFSVDAVPYENLHDKQVLQLSSHSGGYDIVYVHPGWFGEYAKAGYLKPIGSYLSDKSLNPAGFAGASAYLPAILKQGVYNGQQYCLQDFVGTVLLAYRKDVSDTLSSLLISLGTWWYNDAGKPSLDRTKAAQAISFYVQMAKSAPSGILNYHFDQVAIAAAQGKAAMMIANTPSIARLIDPKQSKTVGKWAYLPLAVSAKRPAGE